MLKYLIIVFLLISKLGFGAFSKDPDFKNLKESAQNATIDTVVFDLNYALTENYIKVNPDSGIKYINIALNTIDKYKNPQRYFNGINIKAGCYWFNNTLDSAIALYRQAMDIALMLKDSNRFAKACNNIGVCFQYSSEIDSAKKYLDKACSIYKQTGNSKAYAKASLDLGALYTNEGEYDIAIDKLLEAIGKFEEIEDTTYIIHSYNGIGNLYLNIDDGESAIYYYRKALDYIKKFEKLDISDEIYNNIGLAFFQANNNYDSAEYYFYKALNKENIENNHLLYPSVLVNLATLKNNKGEYSEALKYFIKVKELDFASSDPYSRMVCNVNLGNTYLEIHQYSKARESLKQGLKDAKKLNNKEFQKNAYLYLARLDSAQNNFKSAFYNYQKYSALVKKLHNIEVEEKIQMINSKHHLKEIQSKNLLLEKQNQLKKALLKKHKYLNILTGILLLLTISILIFTYYMYRKSYKLNQDLKEKNIEINKQKEKQQTLNNQLNKLISIIAHDLKAPFNALLGLLKELDNNSDQYSEEEKNAIIKGLLENTKSTYKLLENLMEWSVSKTGLLTMNIERINIAQLTEEVLQLNHIQLHNKMITVSNGLSPHTEVYADHKMTFTILTNLINNAIKFNHQGGIIAINSEMFEDFVRICIKDNGIGIPKKHLDNLFSIDSSYQTRGTENEYGTGLGLKVVYEFIQRMNGKVSVMSEEGKGATFCFELPIKNPEA